jgi:GNAT superfamily N-acetyltransferase
MLAAPVVEMNEIKLAENDDEIAECFPVLAELRPHLAQKEFPSRINGLTAKTGFRMAFLRAAGEIKAVAGLRISEWLAFEGPYCEIEDLVTAGSTRSKGYGGELFDWIVEYARGKGCTHLRLVSHVARTDAHRFYERKGMTHLAHYFTMDL